MSNRNRLHDCTYHGYAWPVLLAALSGLLPVPAGSYELVDLGADVSPTDISNHGTITGLRRTDAGNVGFRKLPGGPLEDIPGTTVAYAVNEADQITGNTLTGAFLLDGTMRDWDGYGGYGINESGQISGNRELDNPYRARPLPLDPAVYTPNKWDNPGVATVYPRGTRQGVYADIYVLNDINDAGFAVGSKRRAGLAGSASFLTTPAFDGVTFLSTPYGGQALAINNLNHVVGATGTNSTTGAYSHAYLLDYNTGILQDLGTLHGGLTSSAADINEYDQVVGTSWLVTELTSVYDPSLYHAFLWQDGVMNDLNNELPPGSGMILTAATAINDNGDIVGMALRDGQSHGFLLTNGPALPPPANQPPVAMATADTTSGRAPLTVNFEASGSYDYEGAVVAWSWDFGDGSAVTTEPNPSHVYTDSGTWIAVLTVTDSGGLTASAMVEIRVRKPGGGGKH